jgi:predicted Fe-S protein YdhL (DUF1289 family)
MGKKTLSPCIGICRINIRSGFCEGCSRTPEEISAWPKLLPEQRREVMLVLEKRQAATAVSRSS